VRGSYLPLRRAATYLALTSPHSPSYAITYYYAPRTLPPARCSQRAPLFTCLVDTIVTVFPACLLGRTAHARRGTTHLSSSQFYPMLPNTGYHRTHLRERAHRVWQTHRLRCGDKLILASGQNAAGVTTAGGRQAAIPPSLLPLCLPPRTPIPHPPPAIRIPTCCLRCIVERNERVG